MPVYEYVCEDCETRFEELRPMARIDEPARCPDGHVSSRRVLSTFAPMSRDSAGDTSAIGGGGCGGCDGSCGASCACAN